MEDVSAGDFGEVEIQQYHIWHHRGQPCQGRVSRSDDLCFKTGRSQRSGKDGCLVLVIFDNKCVPFAHIVTVPLMPKGVEHS